MMATMPSRRAFISQGSTAVLSYLDTTRDNAEDMPSLLEAKTISWDGPSFTSSRYGTSTLLSSNSNNKNTTPSPGQPAFYPQWMEGYYSIRYKFKGASFPQGRKILSLRTAGAGLGTCLSLPNVGNSPEAPHAMHFIKGGGNDNNDVYEDLAYNVPRRFESFWPQAKVTSVQTNGKKVAGSSSNNINRSLSPKCLVTGEGCTADANPNLHMPASRVAIEFDGPTRRGGRIIQSSDVTMLDCSAQYGGNNDSYYTTKICSQYNVNQDLQTFYKEITSLRRINVDVDDDIVGRVRVAAFLPRFAKDMEANNNIGSGDAYDENEAVAIYNYDISMKIIDEAEAAFL